MKKYTEHKFKGESSSGILHMTNLNEVTTGDNLIVSNTVIIDGDEQISYTWYG